MKSFIKQHVTVIKYCQFDSSMVHLGPQLVGVDCDIAAGLLPLPRPDASRSSKSIPSRQRSFISPFYPSWRSFAFRPLFWDANFTVPCEPELTLSNSSGALGDDPTDVHLRTSLPGIVE